MSRWERAVVSVKKHNEITDAVIAGMEKSERMKYTKPYDKAVSIVVSLEEAGFKIVRKSKPQGDN